MQLFGLVNEFLSENDGAHRWNLIIQRYPVIPLASNSGLLGWIDQCNTFHTLIKDYREKVGILFDIEYHHMKTRAVHYEQLLLINKIQVLRKNLESLMTVLEAFVHDPIINWRLLEPILSTTVNSMIEQSEL